MVGNVERNFRNYVIGYRVFVFLRAVVGNFGRSEKVRQRTKAIVQRTDFVSYVRDDDGSRRRSIKDIARSA